ncbi:DUF4349 domain-containing protein [Actinomadura sp. 7K507]|uniref:DUF4349 domain-containing protein n=1 Tax=Actinomadura sp. 7K507 TaxID=2530365 RepID=UPI0014053835|nr:DUF4349 domain-containing protein [Actinomadura sp. 7K507]
MRSVRHVTWAFIVLLLAGMLAACGGGDSGGSESAGGSAARAPATSDTREGGGDGGGDDTSGNGEDAGTRKKPRAPAAEREVVHSAELRVRSGDVNASAAKAKQLVIAAGGYVERESSRSEPARSEIALKIPSGRYTELLNQLGTQLGTKLALSQEAEDVTGEVADVEARVRSAEATLTSFRKLFERAGSIEEIIRLEEEISERESDLEALQARQKSLKNRTQFATVTVTLVAESAPDKEPEDDGSGGFVGGLQDGWSAFTTFVGGLAMVVGWLLPFLVTAAVLGLPVLAFRHRLRDRFGNGASPAGSTPPAGGAPGPEPQPEQSAVGAAEKPAQGRQEPPPPQ